MEPVFDILPEWAANFLLLLLGALMVGVFAHRQFELKSGFLESVQPEILEAAPLRMLAGKTGYGRGLVLYVIMFEIAFLLLSTSTLLFSIAYELAKESSTDLVGFSEKGEKNLDGDSTFVSNNALVPLVVAGIIVSVANFPFVSDIEALLRSIAHSVSGIPRNIYSALDKIRRFDFVAQTQAVNPSIVNASALGKKTADAARSSEVEDVHVEALEQQVARIYSLEPWLTGKLTLFSSSSQGELTKITREIAHDSSVLKTRLKHAVEDETTKEEWEALITEVMHVSDSVSAAFGVYAPKIPLIRLLFLAPVIDELLDAIAERSGRSPLNTVIGTLLWGSVISFMVVSLTRWLSSFLSWKMDNAGSGTEIYSDVVWGDLYRALQNGFSDVLSFAVLFLVASISALSLRSSKIESDSWISHSNEKIHYSQYAVSSVIIWIFISIPFQIIFSAALETIPLVVNVQDGWQAFRSTLDLNQLKASIRSSVVVVPIIWTIFKFSDIIEIDRRNIGLLNLLLALLFIFIFVAASSGFFANSFGDISKTLVPDFLRQVVEPSAVYVCYLLAMMWISRREHS